MANAGEPGRVALASEVSWRARRVFLGGLVLAAAACGTETPPASIDPPEPVVDLPEVVRLSASSATISLGGQVDLTWEVSRAATVSISAPPDFEVFVEASGTLISPRLTEATRFSLRAENAAGVVWADATVAVQPPPEAARIDRFLATPETFSGGSQEVSLFWQATGRLQLFVQGVEDGGFPGQAASLYRLRIAEPTVFALVATGEDGSVVRAEARVQRVGEEIEPNDRREEAQAIEPGTPIRGTITQGDVDWYAVWVPEGFSVSASLDPDCGFDSLLELWGPAAETPLEPRFLAENHGPHPEADCAGIDPAAVPAAVERVEGLHFLAVRGFDRSSVGAYQLSVDLVAPGCGNGLVEPRQGEQCDPPGQRCSADCRVEGLRRYTGPPLVLELRPAVPVEIRLEAAGTIFGRVAGEGGECPSGAQIGRFDLDRTGGRTLLPVGTSTRCELIAEPLPAGRYLVDAEGPASLALTLSARARGCGDAVLDVGEECDEGDPTEGCGPDCRLRAAAVAEPGVAVELSIPPGATRYVRVPVSVAGSSIQARVLSDPACFRLGLADDGFYFLTEASPGEPLSGAEELYDRPAEDVFVAVTRTGPVGTARVLVDVVPPACGDGRIQHRIGEQCEPSLSSVPCTADCRFSVAATQPASSEVAYLPFVLAANEARFLAVTATAAGRMFMLLHPESLRPPITNSNCDRGPRLRAALYDEEGRRLLQQTERPCPSLTRQLPAGTHYVLIENLDAAPAASSSELLLNFPPGRCGDGIVDVGEECDGGAGCRSDCTLQGGMRREREPNDDPRRAEPLHPFTDRSLVGRLPVGDRDVFAIDIAPDSEMPLEVRLRYEDSPLCGDTRIRWRDARGRVLREEVFCRLSFRERDRWLREGRYYLELVARSFPPVGVYRLEVDTR